MLFVVLSFEYYHLFGLLLSPTQRQRLIRSYNEKGEWTGITLVTEEKENY